MPPFHGGDELCGILCPPEWPWVGIGLDEDTAAFISPDNTVQVEGSGGITVVDAAEVQFSSMDTTEEGRPVCLLGLKLHILAQGATFNLHSRLADAGALVQSKR